MGTTQCRPIWKQILMPNRNAKARKEKKRLLNKKLSKMGRTANQVKKWKAKQKASGIDIRNIRWN